VQTVHVDVKKTATTLRVPGIVNPDEYREVHVTSLVGGVIKQVPVVLGDHVKRWQPLAVVFSSELAEAETQYLSHLAELEADHKKLVRTQTWSSSEPPASKKRKTWKRCMPVMNRMYVRPSKS